MIALLLSCFLASDHVDTPHERSTRVVEIEVDLPPSYSAADFRYISHRIRSTPKSSFRNKRRDRKCKEPRDACLIVDGDRLLAHIPNSRGHENRLSRSTSTHSLKQLDLYSVDGFFRASATVPMASLGEFAKVPMQLKGGSALSLILHESPHLKSLHSANPQQTPHFVLMPNDGMQPSIEAQFELGSPHSLDALAPGTYTYRAWTNRSQVIEGSIQLQKLKSATLDLQFVPSHASGEIRVRIQGSEATDSNANVNRNLFLLLESASGPERMFVAQTDQLSIVAPDAYITWSIEDGKRVGTAVFRDVPNGNYQLSTAPGFGLSPETSLVKVGEVVDLKLFDHQPAN